MLIHLPISIFLAFAPMSISDVVPKFDIAKECHFESESSQAFDRCSRDEAEAFEDLQAEWTQFDGASKSACLTEATTAGFASYVDLLICLQMSKDVANDDKADAAANAKPRPQSETSVVDKHD